MKVAVLINRRDELREGQTTTRLAITALDRSHEVFVWASPEFVDTLVMRPRPRSVGFGVVVRTRPG